MKKRITILIILLLFATGCTINTKLKENEIITIKDNSIVLLSKDYKQLLQHINHLSFSKREENIKVNNTLTITSKDNIHIFQISKDHKIKYQVGKNIYYSNNQKTIKKIQTLLANLKKEYLKRDFFQISELKKYEEKKNDLIIKIDNVSQYFSLTSTQEIKQFQIHKVEWKNNQYHDIDLIYENKKITKGKRIVIRMNPQKDYYRYRISFTNEYGLTVSIIPTYEIEKETGLLQYVKDYHYEI